MNPPKSRILPAACLWFLTLLTLSVKAQPTTQDCLGAVPVCSPTLTSSGIITGTGNIPNEINPINSCMLTGERNDTWYLIGIGSSGLLRFSIVPNNLTENYNWALFDLTNSPCSAIFTNPALEVECNYSNTAGVTGANGQPGPQNHAPIPVTAGQILVLNVSAFSSINQSGYTLDFSATAAGVIDNTPPSITSVSAMNCGATSIGVTFNEMIDCASVLPSGLQLTGPGGPYTVTAVTASNCSAGGDFSKSFTVSFSPALVSAGSYTLSLINPVTDVCGNPTSMPQSFSFPVAAMNVSFNQTNVTCFGGNNGSLTANVTGSAGPYTYQWSPSGGSNSMAQFLTAGTYTVTVTNSGGCSVTASATITQPLTGLTATSVVTPANGCAANGSATVTVSNGQPPFTYNWWPTGGTGSTATGLTAGGYMVTITDANQCALNYFLNIPSANGPAASIVASTDVSCHGGNDGSATVAVTGSAGPFGYSWSPSGGTAATATGLTAGNYTVTVTVNATCILTATVVIVEPPTPLSVTSSFISTSCGNNNGSISINASGSVPPYTYSWTPAVSAGSSASGLSPGNYAVTVSDANGCTQSASFTIAASTALSLSLVNHSNISCNGSANGSTGVSVSGGQPPYSYQWSSGQTTSTINGLNAGTYTVTVTDASGCTATLSDVITQPSALTITAPVVQHVLCFGNATGSVSFTASGGQSPLTWQWSGGVSSGSSATGLTAGTYSVTVTDANGCSVSGSAVVNQPTAPLSVQASITNTICGNSNGVISLNTSGGTGPYVYVWNNGTTTASLSGLGAGLYTVTVTDAQGCSLTDTYALQASGAPQLTLVSLTDVSCHGGNNGSAVLSANGGVQPYTWSWSGGVSSSSSATGLQAGTYAVTVTDATGCQSVQQLNIFEPNPLLVAINGTSSVCQGSQAVIAASVQGGTPAYQYQWNTGAVTQSVTVLPWAATTYTVTVTDANGCTSAPQSFTVTVADPLSMNISAPDTVCQGLAATITVVASGGDGNYVYTWSNGMSGASNTIQVNSPVLLTVTVSDGCGSPAVQQQVQVAMVSPPVLSVAMPPQKGCEPFVATFTLPGAPMPGVTYQWEFGDGTSATGTQLSHTYSGHGNYQVMLTAWATASPACSTTVNSGGPVTVLPQPEARFEYSPSVPTVSRPEVRFDDRSTYASSWRWNFGDQSPEETIPDPVHLYRSAGVFKVRLDVTSADGCADSVYRDVEVVEDMEYFIPNAFTADENGINDQFQIFGVGFDSYEITIFDRWGKRIHQSKNGANPWDGKDMETGKQVPQGMYICKIVMTDKLGKSVTRFTHVTLLR